MFETKKNTVTRVIKTTTSRRVPFEDRGNEEAEMLLNVKFVHHE